MGPRPLLLTAVAAVLALTACDGGASPDPAPSPTSAPTTAPTSTPTGSPVPSDDASCPPIPGFQQQLVTVQLRNTTPLPDGGRIGLAEWLGDSVLLKVVRATPGCPTDAFELELAEGSGATVRGVRIDVVSVNRPGVGGSVPTVQLRMGPPG